MVLKNFVIFSRPY